jgi:hypothetical protein
VAPRGSREELQSSGNPTGGLDCLAGIAAFTSGLSFARWRPLDQDALSRPAVLAPAREDEGGRVATGMIARSPEGGSRRESKGDRPKQLVASSRIYVSRLLVDTV